MDINEEIKKESEKFEIHSTSKMILARYLTEKKPEPKKRKRFWLPFGLSLGTVAVAALSTFLAIRFKLSNKRKKLHFERFFLTLSNRNRFVFRFSNES